MTRAEDPLAPYRGRLLGLAYRMLGSRADAEDVVQDVYLRYHDASGLDNVEAWLVTTVTRQCIDRIRSARARREVYVGQWLPEPVLDEAELSPQTAMELADDLSFALLIVLQRLSPSERAAFLLHDIFDLSFAEVAAILGKSEVACRQLATRARKAVTGKPPVRPGPRTGRTDILAAFGKAVASGDPQQMVSLLKEDAVLVADGGGMKLTALNPITGADRIARFFAGIMRKFSVDPNRISWEATSINGAPGMVTFLDGEVEQATILVAEGDRISSIYIVRNPEKLERIGKDVVRRSAFVHNPIVESLQ